MLPSRGIGVKDAVAFDAAVAVRGVMLERSIHLKPVGREETTEPVAGEIADSDFTICSGFARLRYSEVKSLRTCYNLLLLAIFCDGSNY